MNKIVKNDYNRQEIKERFYYCPTSPTGLRYTGFGKHMGRFKDQPAGFLVVSTKDFYKHYGVNFKFEGRRTTLSVSRVILSLFRFIPENLCVDHIDGNPLNNILENLRLVTLEENSRNAVRGVRATKSKNKVPEVRKFTNPNGDEYYHARYSYNKKRISKYFPIALYGEDEAFHLACEWRKTKIAELNEQGAGYTERHGT